MWLKEIIFFASLTIALSQYRGYNSNWRQRGQRGQGRGYQGGQRNGYVANWPPRQWRPPMKQYGSAQYPPYVITPPYQPNQQYPQQQYRRPWWNTEEKLSSGFEPVKVGFGPDPDTYNRNRNQYGNRKILYNQYIDPRTIPEVKPTCQPRRCYFVCRMKNLGGGRCTKGGCMCYAGFFAYDGSPLTRQYQEDDIWFDLTSDEQTQIKTNMARWSKRQSSLIPNKPNPNPGGNSGKPPYNPGSNSGKPPYNPGGNSGKPPINQGGNNDWGDLYPDNNNNPGGSSNSGNDWSNLYPDNNNNNPGGSNSGKPSHNHGGNSGKPSHNHGGNSGKPAYDNSNNNNNPGGNEGSGTGLDWNDDDEEDYGGGYDDEYDEDEDFWGR